MKITLSTYEVREALAEAIEKKTNHMVIDVDPDDCWFDVKSVDGEIEDIESVEFTFNTESE